MATIRTRHGKKGTTYTAQVRLMGVDESSTFERKTDAKAWAVKTEAAIRERRHTAAGERRTVGELIDVYSTSPSCPEDYLRHLAWWRSELGMRLLRDVRRDDIARRRDSLADGDTPRGKRSPATVNRYLGSLSCAFNYGVKDLGWIETNPVRSVSRLKEPSGRVRFLSRPQDEKNSELRRLIEACKESQNPRLTDLVLLAILTGMRENEIVSLRREHVRLAEGGIALSPQDTKTNAARFVTLSAEALGIVRRLFLSADPYLFGKPGANKAPRFPKKAWLRALRIAGISNFRFHDLRHTAGSYLAMAGATTREIMDTLGHKTPAMAIRYSHLAGEHKRQVAEKLAAVVAEAKQSERRRRTATSLKARNDRARGRS